MYIRAIQRKRSSFLWFILRIGSDVEKISSYTRKSFYDETFCYLWIRARFHHHFSHIKKNIFCRIFCRWSLCLTVKILKFFLLADDPCRTGEVFCDGTCFPAERRCDGRRDCRDGTDEQDCPGCGFRCGDGTCIPSQNRCDGTPHCRSVLAEVLYICLFIS